MGANPHSETQWDSEPTSQDVPAPALEGYEIEAEVGHGSMGYVYRAKSAEFGTVAIKILNFFAEGSDMAVERFRREVSVGARIGHPGIPTVFDSGRLPDGRFYLVMELLSGSDLEEWWDAAGHTRAEALDLICEVLEPLAAAHQHGVVHRDMKPENCFVEQSGRIRLLDFGVARSPDASQNVRTATGIAVGTPVYMSPEQATKPAEVDTPSDVWSAGVMLYEALCGELPFAGESPHAVVLRACTEEPTPLGERVPEVHEDLRRLVQLCLNKDPSQRPQNAGELHAKLAPLLERKEVRATLQGPAAAPSFRLSSSPQAIAASPGLASGVSTMAPEASPPRWRKFAVLALVGLAAALALALVMSETDEVAGSPSPAVAPATDDETGTDAQTAAPPLAAADADDSRDSGLAAQVADSQAAADDAAQTDGAGTETRDETSRDAESAGRPRSRGTRRGSLAQSRDRETTNEPEPPQRASSTSTSTAMEPASPNASPSPERPASTTNSTATVAPAATMAPAPAMTATPPPREAATPMTAAAEMTAPPRPRPRPRPPAEMRPERPGFVTF